MSVKLVSETWSGSRSDSRATNKYVVTGTSEVEPFALSLVGGYQTVDGELQYVVPAVHPFKAGIIATDYSVEPIDYGMPEENQLWSVTVNFAPPENDEQEEEDPEALDIGEVSLDFAAQEITLSKGNFTWQGGENDGLPLGEEAPTPTKRIGQCELNLKYHYRPSLDLVEINSLSGKINSGTFRGFGIEKVLFMGASTSRKRTTDGFQAWEITYKFLTRDESWNKILDPDGTWRYTQPRIYETADLNDLGLL